MTSMIKEKLESLTLLNIEVSFFLFFGKQKKMQILKKLSREHPEAKMLMSM